MVLGVCNMSLSMEREQAKRERLLMLANGWTPLRNRDKRCFLNGWPRLVVTPELIDEWARRHGRDLATGVRLDNGLCVPDLDIPDHAIVNAIADAALDIIPELQDQKVPWLIRSSGAAKEAWFFRTREPFGRIRSEVFAVPGSKPDDGETGLVEIFGGATSRQFGAFGPHTITDTGDVLRRYEWHDRSLLDTRLDELPLVKKSQMYELVDAAQTILRAAGWQKIKLQSRIGENVARRAYDLAPVMSFVCLDGMTRSLEEMKAALGYQDHLRCSASWLEGAKAVNPTRCIARLTKGGFLQVWESAASVTHIEAAAKPVEVDLKEVRTKLAHSRYAAPKW